MGRDINIFNSVKMLATEINYFFYLAGKHFFMLELQSERLALKTACIILICWYIQMRITFMVGVWATLVI